MIAGFDEWGKDHDETLENVLQAYTQANLKLNINKYLFRCTSIPFFGETISWQGVSPDPRKAQALTDMPLPKTKKELQSFLSILNYLSRFSPMTAEVCEPLPKLTSGKTDQTLNRIYHNLYGKKQLVKRDACMKFYDVAGPLYLEIDASGISLEARLLQVRDVMNCRHDEIPHNAILCLTALMQSGTTATQNMKPFHSYMG